jgi:DNA repair exonuclease SbcCD ATPase subunit
MEVVRMKKVLILLILFVFTSPAYAATAYKWVDKQGVISLTDDYSNVPSEYRAHVSTEVMEETPSVGIPTSAQATPPKIEEAKTDSYGLSQTNWREKVRFWEEQLSEATKNYDNVYKKFMGQAESLVRVRFGSKTQYKMGSYALRALTRQLEEYRAKIVEAEKMLAELSKETGEANANLESPKSKIARPTQEIVPTEREEINTDIYGRDKTWWREKISPWREQLKEATKNYERVREEFIKQGGELGPFRWGRLSLTQYQFISLRLNDLNVQMAKYQAQIVEANEMLGKLSKEAIEVKADPTWLNE